MLLDQDILLRSAVAEYVEPAPIAVQTTRYLCPYCRRGRSRPQAVREHMPKCFKNPALKGCKTCVFFQSSAWQLAPRAAHNGKPVAAAGRCKAGYSLRDGLVTKCNKWQLLV